MPQMRPSLWHPFLYRETGTYSIPKEHGVIQIMKVLGTQDKPYMELTFQPSGEGSCVSSKIKFQNRFYLFPFEN